MQAPRASELLHFLREHGDQRITRAARRFYKDWKLDNIAVIEHDGEKLVGVSLCGVGEGKTTYSVVAVHKEYRNRGIGKRILQTKIDRAHELGIKYRGLVAEDNEPSNRMCRAVKLPVVDTVTKTRREDEEYKVLIYEA